jgi:hypothetical protein
MRGLALAYFFLPITRHAPIRHALHYKVNFILVVEYSVKARNVPVYEIGLDLNLSEN